MANEQIDSVLAEYLAECEELTQRVSNNLRAVEKGQWTAETIDSIYRDIHTVKGSAQLFGYLVIGEIGHAMETTLDPVRRHQRAPTPAHLEALFKCLDAIEQAAAAIRTGNEAELAPLGKAVVEMLNASCADAPAEKRGEASLDPAGLGPAFQQTPAAAPKEATNPELRVAPETGPVDLAAEFLKVLNAERTPSAPAPTPVVAAPAPAPAEKRGEASLDPAGLRPAFQQTPTPAPVAAAPVAPAPASPAHVAPAPAAPAPAPVATAPASVAATPKAAPAAPPAAGSGETDSSSSIRVPVALLDKLMILMGEMVLVRNQVLQYANRNDDLEFLNLSQRLDVVTSEIQGEIMKTRMQPIGNVLGKFHRVVRDLSRDLGKKIELQLSGTETELDKTLLEAVKDPIMHIVRNSCDHGLENAEDRKAAGKPETGTINVRSFHEGGQVIVEISDDGRGLHREKITAKAVEKGLLTAEKAAALSDREAQALIFAPGFSTAAHVTNVSGRGVGMDVVKSNIEGIGGMVDLNSRPGHGTSIRLKIPLTLAIVPAMIVRCRDERFAIPQVKLVELVRVEKGVGTSQIEMLQGRPIYRLRGNLLPLLTLDQILGISAEPAHVVPDVSNIVVLNAEGKLFGLIVDEVQDTAEVVVKPLTSFLKALSVYSGATVLGDGSVALILDVMGIAQAQGLLVESAARDKGKGSDSANRNAEMQEFLLFRVNSPTKHAIPLNLVHRLEEIPRSAIEVSGAQKVIRYRNSVLPIVSLNETLGLGSPESTGETLAVIVLKKAGRYYGVQVDEILDVLNTAETMDDGLCDRLGILGNIVTEEEIVVVVDALQILDAFARKHQPSTAPAQEKAPSLPAREVKILFAEDTAFFRKHVVTVLTRAGFKVTTAVDGAQALQMLESALPGDFDIVLSDVEMPNMNGLELATAVRQNARWSKIPMLALTTKFSAAYAEEGRRAGFDAYLEKLNPEVLLRAIAEALQPDTQRRSA